jgi:hypothetical protein
VVGGGTDREELEEVVEVDDEVSTVGAVEDALPMAPVIGL